jgi:hypothetical protein
MIEIQGLTRRQRILADTLWNKCLTQNEVDYVLNTFGVDARIVYEMIIAHTMDQYMNTDEAQIILERFMKYD